MLASLSNAWARFGSRQMALEFMVSVCLACLVWLYTHNRSRNSIDRVAVPVQVQLAAHQRDQFVLEISESRNVLVSFSGPHSRIREVRRKLQRGQLKAMLSLTVAEAQKNEAMFTQTLRVTEEAMSVPAGVKVEIAEESLAVTVHRLTERTLPVKLETTGEARITQLKIEPANVLVRGPKAVLDRAAFISTQPYAVEVNSNTAKGPESNAREQIALVTELDGRPIQTNPATVQFRLRAVPLQKTYELADVPIHFLLPKDSPWKARFTSDKDAKVTLKLTGPVLEQAPPILAFVDLSKGNLARGRNLEPLRLQLPKDFQLAQPAAPLVSFFLDEIERPENKP